MRDQPAHPWHAWTIPAVLVRLGSSDVGLPQAEAAKRLAEFGPNVLPHRPPPAAWAIVLRQFRSPLIYVLGIAAALSLAVGEPRDAAFITVVLLLNAAVGGYQEWRAEQSSRVLQKLLTVRAPVMRDGEVRDIEAVLVVPGDVAWLESGLRVPADVRLIRTHGLEIDESLLTGESLPVLKASDVVPGEQTPVADRRNIAYAGSMVARGRGAGVVVATSAATAVGQLALEIEQAGGGKPPLAERLERFTRAIGAAALIASVAVGLLGVFGRGYAPREMVFFAIALAVSAIPEGLPVALTVALAVATGRMARRGVIVRQLPAVEGLGSCTLIASDKTGTLTCNELTVREVRLPSGEALHVTGEGFAPTGQVLARGRAIAVEDSHYAELQALARAAALCNEADLHRVGGDGDWVWRGDPTDVALLSFAHKLGLNREAAPERYPQVNQIPFEPEHKFAATYHSVDGVVRTFVKGAPERVIAMCAAPARGSGSSASWLSAAHALAEQGLRVLAVAEGAAPADLDASRAPSEPSDLRLLGFIGMIDPLRPGVREAVENCHRAGVGVWMVTGDHPITALAIARELNLASVPNQVVTGPELSAQSAEKLKETIRTARVFARVSPQQKLQLVQAARESGHFVAVTGDGVNDAPALRAANIGVAMGRAGTDVAREAADLVITDDNFATIVAGIEEGRVAYNNIRNVVFMLVSTGAGEVVLAALALMAGLPLPLLAVQLLWLNLVTNGIQDVALAFEPGLGDELHRGPRSPKEKIFNRLMVERSIFAALVIGIVGFGAFSWMLDAGWSEAHARNGLLLLMVLFENVHLGNCRSESVAALRMSPFRSPLLLAGAVVALLVHVLAMHTPLLQRVLQVEPLTAANWIVLLSLAMTIFVVMELHKWAWRIRRRPTETHPPLSPQPAA